MIDRLTVPAVCGQVRVLCPSPQPLSGLGTGSGTQEATESPRMGKCSKVGEAFAWPGFSRADHYGSFFRKYHR